MKPYKIIIDEDALLDIKESVNWYNSRVENLGLRFKKNVKEQINILKLNAEIYSIKYKIVHCTLVKDFPFLIHFVINDVDRSIKILAVIHFSRSPEIWEEKTKDL